VELGELNHERLQVLLGAVADAELTTMEERAAVGDGRLASAAATGWQQVQQGHWQQQSKMLWQSKG